LNNPDVNARHFVLSANVKHARREQHLTHACRTTSYAV